MLVLGRRYQEKIIVTTASGERIVITVVDIRGDRTRLGFEADPSTVIDREEIDDLRWRESRNGGHA